jgi:nucleotidyltransferase/DNA polymerase involved in DNA repair
VLLLPGLYCREGLIAVNYAARGKGITRHMRVAEAKHKCPELVLVHVETIGGHGEPCAIGSLFLIDLCFMGYTRHPTRSPLT